jgi:hypothetical protein
MLPQVKSVAAMAIRTEFFIRQTSVKVDST